MTATRASSEEVIDHDAGERKWSWNKIGKIVGVSGVTAKSIADPEYAAKRSAYKVAA